MSESKFETISALVDNYQTVASTNRDESLNEFITEHAQRQGIIFCMATLPFNW